MRTNIIKTSTEINDIPSFVCDSTLSVNLWFTGCYLNCANCHNKNLQYFRWGLDSNYIVDELIRRKKLCDWLVFIGGEPLYSKTTTRFVHYLSRFAKHLGYKTFLYSGYDYNDIELRVKFFDDFFKYIDYVKCGKYDNTKIDSDYLLASTNQCIYNKGQKIYFYNN